MDGYGSSLLGQWDRIVNAVESSPWPHERILDMGAGQGKAEALLREYLNVKPEWVAACEPNPAYAMRLQARYDQVWTAIYTAQEFPWYGLFDTVIMADVIEHIPWGEGMRVLQAIPGQVIVSTPVDALAADNEGVPELEQHLCQWDLNHFNMTGRLDRAWVWQSGQANIAQHIVRLRPLAA